MMSILTVAIYAIVNGHVFASRRLNNVADDDDDDDGYDNVDNTDDSCNWDDTVKLRSQSRFGPSQMSGGYSH
jgi:hypothetical protein